MTNSVFSQRWLVGILKSLGIGFIGVLIVYLVVFPSSPLRQELFDQGCVSNLKRLRKALVDTVQ